ncbi:MAG: hypothetical protein HQL03_13085 [Nitrospirae bacterium]|nr:hypothetical protein [Nitrospirota bacterium]
MSKKVLVLSVMAVFMLLGVSYGASITGVIESIAKDKGTFSVRDQKIEVGFSCDGSLLKDLSNGDSVKVEYSIESGKAKAVSVNKVSDQGKGEIVGTIKHIDKSKNSLIVKDKEIEIGFDCSGTPLNDFKEGDTVIVNYTVKDGREIAEHIKKKL